MILPFEFTTAVPCAGTVTPLTDSVSPFGSVSLASTAISAAVSSGVAAASFAATGLTFVVTATIFTSSTAASTRLAPPASAASTRILIVWPENALRLTLAVVHAASSSLPAPTSCRTSEVVVPTTETRR